MHSLQQLDLLYLDEPAPLADELGLVVGRPVLIIVCLRCQVPGPLPAAVQVVMTGDSRKARAYGLATDDGRLGPGYALIDSRGRLRYRTFDPGLQENAREVVRPAGGVAVSPRRTLTAAVVLVFEGPVLPVRAVRGAVPLLAARAVRRHVGSDGPDGVAAGATSARRCCRALGGRGGRAPGAVPDVLFLAFGVLHMLWMDVFALRISLHFVPRPLQTQLALFALSLIAYALAGEGRRRPVVDELAAGGVVLGVALLLRSPVPSDLGVVRSHPGPAWMCPLTGVDVGGA